MGSKTVTQTQQTSTKDPFAPAIPHLGNIMGQAGQLYKQRMGQSAYGGRTFADFSPETMQAFDMISRRAQGGSQLMRDAQGMIGDTASGKYLSDGNPFTSQFAQATANQIAPSLNATFARAGRTGSDAHQYNFAKGMTDGLAPINSAAYESERNRMMQAAGMAPQMAMQDYFDAQMLRGVGQEKEAMSQRGINEDMARYQFEQDKMGRALAEYLGITQGVGSMGGTNNSSGTQTQEQKQNPWQTALGAGLMGASMFAGGPMAGMGGLGGMGGMFGSGSMGGMGGLLGYNMGMSNPWSTYMRN